MTAAMAVPVLPTLVTAFVTTMVITMTSIVAFSIIVIAVIFTKVVLDYNEPYCTCTITCCLTRLLPSKTQAK